MQKKKLQAYDDILLTDLYYEDYIPLTQSDIHLYQILQKFYKIIIYLFLKINHMIWIYIFTY